MNIVIVTDEPVLATLARRPLEPLGHTVSAVASIAELEHELDAIAPRAAILPRRLPDRTQLLRSVRKLLGHAAPDRDGDGEEDPT